MSCDLQQILTKIEQKLFQNLLISLKPADSGSQILNDQLALTLSFMQYVIFTWECVGIERCALQSVGKLF